MEANEQLSRRPARARTGSSFASSPTRVVLLQELRSGGVDFIENPPLTEMARLKQTAGLRVLVADNTSYTYLGWRQDVAPFTDIRVRRALNHAIDVPSIIRKCCRGTRRSPPDSSRRRAGRSTPA